MLLVVLRENAHTQRDMTITECCKDKTFFMKMPPDGTKLKETYTYFYQCQGVLNLTNLKWIDFVVYSTKELFVQHIEVDILWNVKMLPKLTSFYVKYLHNKQY